MAIINHSQEAEAAKRFVEATRNVDLAFRAARGKAESDPAAAGHDAAQSRLDRALDELARAQELFDTVVRVRRQG